MIFTVEDKTIVKILYLIIRYGLREVRREFPEKGRKNVLIGQRYHRAACKGKVEAQACSSIADCERPNERRKRLKDGVLVNCGHFEHRMRCKLWQQLG